jgi:hypothetical protein
MSILTDAIKAQMPALYSQEDSSDPTVHALLFGSNGWVWALTEYSETAPDGCHNLAFGKVYGDFPELGYVSIGELDEVNAEFLPDHGPVWLDATFTPRPLSQVEAELDATRARLIEALESGSHLVIEELERG